MKLLTVSRSFAGGKSQQGLYKMAEQGMLPKFAPVGRPVSLAPNRESDESVRSGRSINFDNVAPVPKSEQNIPMRVSDPSREQASAFAVSASAPVFAHSVGAQRSFCLNAIPAPANLFRLHKNPFANRPVEKFKPTEPLQTELSLDAVKPVRNDLSDTDLEIVPIKAEIKAGASKPPRSRLFKPELAGLAWSRLTARLFNSERVRA